MSTPPTPPPSAPASVPTLETSGWTRGQVIAVVAVSLTAAGLLAGAINWLPSLGDLRWVPHSALASEVERAGTAIYQTKVDAKESATIADKARSEIRADVAAIKVDLALRKGAVDTTLTAQQKAFEDLRDEIRGGLREIRLELRRRR